MYLQLKLVFNDSSLYDFYIENVFIEGLLLLYLYLYLNHCHFQQSKIIDSLFS